jgi:hypothetical protein
MCFYIVCGLWFIIGCKKVNSSIFQQIRAIPKQAKALIASVAKDATNFILLVVVIYDQITFIAANCALHRRGDDVLEGGIINHVTIMTATNFAAIAIAAIAAPAIKAVNLPVMQREKLRRFGFLLFASGAF